MKQMFLFILSVLTITATATAQRDTTAPGLSVYGKLKSASASRIELAEQLPDGTTAVREISITSTTTFEGCAIDSVQSGVGTFVLLSPAKIYPPQAELIHFDGCTPQFDVMASITAIGNSSITATTTAESDFGKTGTSVTIRVTAQTSYISCDGLALGKSDLRLADTIYVRMSGSVDEPAAVTIQTLNDCSQTASAECAFISATSEFMYLLVDGTADTLALQISGDVGRGVPGDSAYPLYSCDGRMLLPTDLQPGMQLSVTYLISPRKGLFLQYGFVKDNCPVAFRGIVTSVNNNIITVSSHGIDTEITVVAATELISCRRDPIAIEDLVVGLTVDGNATQSSNALIAARLSVLDECPFAFCSSGVVLAVNEERLVLDALDAQTGEQVQLEIAFDNATQTVDCSKLPTGRNAIVVGATVGVYHRISKGARIADWVIVLDPCNTSYISGTINSIDSTNIEVQSDRGTFDRYVYDDSSVFVNCRGELYRPDASAVGQRIDGMTATVSTGMLITSATIFEGCIISGIVSGIISIASDSMIEVATSQGMRNVVRAPYSIVMNNDGTMLDWADLTEGRQVCMAVDEQSETLMRAIVDIVCDNGVRQTADASMIVGTLKSTSNNELVVTTSTGVIEFALTPATQMMDEKRNVLSASGMAIGNAVRVMSKGHTNSLTPIASTVVLLSATNVEDESGPVSELSVYPNPVADVVTFGSVIPFESIMITDILGMPVAELRGTTTFDVSKLASGTYVLSARRGSQHVVTKMVKR